MLAYAVAGESTAAENSMRALGLQKRVVAIGRDPCFGSPPETRSCSAWRLVEEDPAILMTPQIQ
jgi:hypothetical protein